MSKLILHCGARNVERAELESVPTPEPTETWFPQPHSQVLTTVEGLLQAAGFSIGREELGLSQDNARFFGTLDLTSPIVEGVSLSIGVRNSHDKTFPIGLVGGSRVFACDNLAFFGEIYVAKKHTRFGKERFDEGISRAIQSLSAHSQVEKARITSYRDTQLSENEAAACLLHAFEQKVLSARTLPTAVNEWRLPSHDEFKPRTAWSLFNALTSALGERRRNPAQFASLTIRAYGLMDRVANFSLAS